MRGKAAKLIRKAIKMDSNKYNGLKAIWQSLSWIEKTKIRRTVESL